MNGVGSGTITLTMTPKGPNGDTKYVLDGRSHDMVFDGRFEDSVQKHFLNPEQVIVDICQLKALFEDPEMQKAREKALQADNPFDTERVQLAPGNVWEMGPPVFGGKTRQNIVELVNPLAEQIIKLGDRHVSIMGPVLDNNVRQTLIGEYDPATRTLTCIHEELQVADLG